MATRATTRNRVHLRFRHTQLCRKMQAAHIRSNMAPNRAQQRSKATPRERLLSRSLCSPQRCERMPTKLSSGGAVNLPSDSVRVRCHTNPMPTKPQTSQVRGRRSQVRRWQMHFSDRLPTSTATSEQINRSGSRVAVTGRWTVRMPRTHRFSTSLQVPEVAVAVEVGVRMVDPEDRGGGDPC